MQVTLRELIDRVLLNLGVSVIDVEITVTDIVHSLRTALRLYNRYVPGMEWASLSVSPEVQRYVISHRNLIGISDVQFLRDFHVYIEMESVPLFTTRMAEIEQWFMRRKDASRILSTQPSWDVLWEVPQVQPGQPPPKRRELVLYVTVPASARLRCSYRYSWAREASDDLMYGIPSIPYNHIQWVEDYTLATAKTILGRVLDKFKGLPSPANTGLDGADLRAEGADEQRRLFEEILSWRQQLPPVIA